MSYPLRYIELKKRNSKNNGTQTTEPKKRISTENLYVNQTRHHGARIGRNRWNAATARASAVGKKITQVGPRIGNQCRCHRERPGLLPAQDHSAAARRSTQKKLGGARPRAGRRVTIRRSTGRSPSGTPRSFLFPAKLLGCFRDYAAGQGGLLGPGSVRRSAHRAQLKARAKNILQLGELFL